MSFPANRSSFWRHFPGLRTIFVWAFLLSVFSLAIRQSISIDPDFWWHLKTGEYIVQTGIIPHLDQFSFTKAGAEWISHEWLSEVVMYTTFRLGGWTGLFLLFGAVITAALGLCYWRSEGKPFIAGLATFIAALASAPLYGLRPQMFTLLLASVFIVILERHLNEDNRRLLWFLPIAMLVWVNLHAGFAVGPALLVLFAVMAAIDGKWNQIKPLLITLAGCLAAIPVNPHGLRMFSYPLETLSSPAMQSLIQEWLSPDFHQIRFLPLAVLMLATVAAVALSPQRIKGSELFGLLMLNFAALRSGRHIPLFAIFAAPILAKYLLRWSTSQTRVRFALRSQPVTGAKVIINLALLCLPAIVVVRQVVDFKKHQSIYESKRYPADAVDVIKNKQLPGPIFNDYNWGGYLIWRLYPERQVFIDGRADVYNDSFLFDYMNTYNADPLWRARFARFGIQTVLIDPNSALATLLRQESGWRTVFEDKAAVVFSRE